MNCKACRERLPDYLLDELPEGEAVLVHEHLKLCEECMTAYAQLKGTGKALDAVPSLGAVKPSSQFGERIRAAAREESQKIIRTLPAEKRLRMEVRRVRLSKPKVESVRDAQPKTSSSPWPMVILVLSAVCVLGAAFVLLRSSSGDHKLPRKVGELSITVDRVESFFKKSGRKWSAVSPGSAVRTGDTYATRDQGLARFDLESGGCLLLGPESELALQLPSRPESGWTLRLASGELGIQRPGKRKKSDDKAANGWSVQTPAALVDISPDSCVFLKIGKSGDASNCEVQLAAGQASVTYGKSKARLLMSAGQSATFAEKAESAPTVKKVENVLPPWRVDLIDDTELARIFGGQPKRVGHHADGLIVELTYGFEKIEGLDDWESEVPAKHLATKRGEPIKVPTEARFTLKMPLAMPLSVEIGVHAETSKDAAFTFAAVKDASNKLSIDLDREAQLQVRQEGQLRVARAPYRADAKAGERVRVEIVQKGHETSASVSSASGKADPLILKQRMEGPLTVWFSSLREGFLLEGIKVKGVVPREKLLERFMLTSPTKKPK